MQNPNHEWDIYDHSMEVVRGVKNLEGNDTVLFSAYYHDIGKIFDRAFAVDEDNNLRCASNGRPYHRFNINARHEETGANYVKTAFSEAYCKEFGVDKGEVVGLIRHHFAPLTYIIRMYDTCDDFESFEVVFNEMKENLPKLATLREDETFDIKDLYILFKADTMGKSSDHARQENILMVADHLLHGDYTARDIFEKQQEMKERYK